MFKSGVLSLVIFAITALSLGTDFSFSGATAMAAQLPNAPYTVASGDTLYSIAQMTTFPIHDLLKVNGFTMQSTIYPGEAIALPFVYKVQQGDALWYIAHHYQTTVAQIMRLNGLTNANIQPGMKLLIARGSRLLKARHSQTLAFTSANVSAQSPGSIGVTGNGAANHAPAQPQGVATISAVATAYDSSVAENGSAGAVDYFGDLLKFGDIAVDPSVIPLGSKVYVSGYTDPALPKGGFYATAVDTGGAIVGDRIDIFLNSHADAIDFGVESVKVTVFKN